MYDQSSVPISPSKPETGKGLFANGVWHCDCQPRLPAERFQVHKHTANHGRWFYTCQRTGPKGCRFFLWDDDAKNREKAAVLGNSRSEPAATKEMPHRTARSDQPSPTKKGRIGELDKNTETDFSLNSEDERLFVDATEDINNDMDRNKGPKPPMAPPETPKKAPRTEATTSPTKRRRSPSPGPVWPTPASGHSLNDDVFSTPSFATSRLNLSSPLSYSDQLRSPSASPSSRRNSGFGTKDAEIEEEALEVLKNSKVSISEDTKEQLRRVFKKHAMRTSGIARGRDVARVALKGRDAKIAELNHRIASLELDLETHRTIVANLRKDQSDQRR